MKQFTYRGVLRTFSNRYHFSGGTPSDAAHWTTLSDAIVTAEKAIYQPLASAGAKIIQTVGYAGGSEIPVFTKAYTTDGTLASTNMGSTPGDAAAIVRYSTAARSTKNHPIYCFNYYHSAYYSTLVNGADTLGTLQATALGVYATKWITSFTDGVNNYTRSRPDGGVCTGSLVEPIISHRDLPH